MSDDQLDDLKQFIAAAISQVENRLTETIGRLEKKVDDSSAGIGDVIDETQEQQEKLNQRLTKLEQKTA